MADFIKALDIIFLQEGGFSNDKTDRGGATDYGISLGFLKLLKENGDINKDGLINVADIRSLTPKKAEYFYYTYFWKPNRFAEIHNQQLANICFSLNVNTGKDAILWLQAALNRLGSNLITDGIIGKNTLKIINKCSSDQIFLIIILIRDQYVNFVRYKCQSCPSQRKYLLGWLNRVYYFS